MSSTSSAQEEQWTAACFGEELFQRLASTTKIIEKDRQKITIFPYKEQAKRLMYRIPIYKPIPSFLVKWSDLTSKLQSEIINLQKDYDFEGFSQIILESVGRLFEVINSHYYNYSVRQYLKVKFIK